MARQVITDEIWTKLLSTMKSTGCTLNKHKVMEAIVWKLLKGVPWRDLSQERYRWKTAFSSLSIAGLKRDFGRIF